VAGTFWGMMDTLSYAAITPTRNEAENLRRLAPCMLAQTLRPRRWIIVDNGSTDETPAIARALAAEHDWVCLLEVPGDVVATRGAPVVRAFHAGVAELAAPVDVVVKLDADVAVDPEYFARQQEAFVEDAGLGIAGGVCMEPQPDGTWAAATVVYDHVRGAIRAYRWDCLQQVTPLEERVGWDGVDEMKAQVNGWRTRTIPGLSFLHYRVYGSRESRWHMWSREGDMSHFMGYRFSYLLARTVYYMRREPSAVGMVWGYAVAAGLRRPRVGSEEAIAHLRELQRVSALPARAREKLGKAPNLSVS
jgi:biofilm PGA synthesis N-glycosyltransferase PgaC